MSSSYSPMGRKTLLVLTLFILAALATSANVFGQPARNAANNALPRTGPLARPMQGQRTAPGGALGAKASARQTPAAPLKNSCVLKSSHTVGSTDVVEVAMEASGEVLQTNENGKTDRSQMEVVAGFKYEERFDQYSTNGPMRTFRCYEQAGMKRKLGANVERSLLDSSRKFIISEFDGKETRIYSTGGSMKNEQYALIHELYFNTTLLDRLLPNREVKLGEDWQLPDDVVVALFGVDAIANNTLHLTLTSVSDAFAEVGIYLTGKQGSDNAPATSTLECASEGASLGLDMEGKFQFDLSTNRITWFGLNIEERRSESVATPGLKWSATIKINVAPLKEPVKLTDDVVKSFKAQPTPEQLMLYYNAKNGPWKFRHSRAWKMIEDGEKITSLCYLRGGEAVAQCNLLSNGKIELSSKPTLEGYKDEIKKGLGPRFAEFKQQAAYEGPGEVSIYYVVADGHYEELPFRWIYYLVTDKDGNQATIMFELRADLLDKYDDSGNDIVESFVLVPRSTAGLRETLQHEAHSAANANSPVPQNAGINAVKQ
ncbi:MAG: hypothetical protein ACOX0A_05175 [Thermoguttaceae bacterium]|jgi:hypothetical protein